MFFIIRVTVAIVALPHAPGDYCPPINLINILCLENLFAPSDEAANEILVPIF